MKHIGFTGTRVGMSRAQTATLRALWSCGLVGGEVWLHHGDCVGSDAQAHDIAVAVGYVIALHPPQEDRLRAFKTGFISYQPVRYLTRNRHIVEAAEHMFATPDGPETLRSGTWSTIRLARRLGKPITIIMPDGGLIR